MPKDKKIYGTRDLISNYTGLVAPRWKLLSLSLALGFAAALAEGIGLSLIYPLLDSVVGTGEAKGFLWESLRNLGRWISGESVVEGLLYLAILVFFMKAILLSSSTFFMTLCVGRMREDWVSAALDHYLYGPYASIIQERRGQILHNIVGEPASAAKAIEQVMALFIKCIFAVVLVATLFVLNWKVMLGLTAVLLLVGFAARPLMLRPMQKIGRKQLRAKQAIKAVVAEPIFGAGTIKLLGVEKFVIEQLRGPLRKFTRLSVLATTFAKAPSDFVEFIIVVSVATVFIVAAHGFGIPFQEAAPLIGSFAVVASRLLSVMSSLLGKRLNLATVAPSLALVHGMLSQDLKDGTLDEGESLGAVESDITFKNVNFQYAENKPLLKNLSMTISKGAIVGIVGPTGIGKSTLGSLIARLYEPDSGAIFINGRNISEYSLRSLRARIGYVEQNPLVFNGTIKENLRLGAGNVDNEQLVIAAKAAGVHDFISSLPDGYESRVGDQGATLSGGERQRLAIARAIVRNPEIYIFDEGTSALDRETEAMIQESIQQLSGDATVVFITHRIATLEHADLIYELLPSGNVVKRTYEEIAA